MPGGTETGSARPHRLWQGLSLELSRGIAAARQRAGEPRALANRLRQGSKMRQAVGGNHGAWAGLGASTEKAPLNNQTETKS